MLHFWIKYPTLFLVVKTLTKSDHTALYIHHQTSCFLNHSCCDDHAMHTLIWGDRHPSPLALVLGPDPSLRPTEIGKIFEIVTLKCNITQKLGTPLKFSKNRHPRLRPKIMYVLELSSELCTLDGPLYSKLVKRYLKLYPIDYYLGWYFGLIK